jgi:hypothetical protein
MLATSALIDETSSPVQVESAVHPRGADGRSPVRAYRAAAIRGVPRHARALSERLRAGAGVDASSVRQKLGPDYSGDVARIA